MSTSSEMSTSVYDTLRHLVAWQAPPHSAVLSIYLDISARRGVEEAVDFARTEWEEALEQAARRGETMEGAQALEALTEQAGTFLEERLEALAEEARAADYDGLAVFLSPDPDLVEVLRLRFAFEDQVLIGRDPFLRQLLFFAEEYERSVCVLVGVPEPESAYVCELHIGDVASVHKVEATQRRALGEELNTVLARMVREVPNLHVILMGPTEARATAEAALSQDVLDQIIDRISPVDALGHAVQTDGVGPGSEGFMRAMHRSLQAYERRSEAEGVSRLVALRADEDRAAVGLAATLSAINKGKLKVLYILQDYEAEGWLCDACDSLGPMPAPPACTVCGATVAEVPLGEHILDQAAQVGAEIDTVKESTALAEVGGVGALLDEP